MKNTEKDSRIKSFSLLRMEKISHKKKRLKQTQKVGIKNKKIDNIYWSIFS